MSIRTSVGQAISSADSCTTPTQLRISSTMALLLARHLAARSAADESKSVKEDIYIASERRDREKGEGYDER